MDSRVPSAITAMRLSFVPLLVFLVSNGMLFFGAVLFLFLLFSDLLDGYLARRFEVSSKFGTYFDVTADFILVFCMFIVFGSKGFYADWIIVLIVAMFTGFVLTGLSSSRIYDPVGKYYGSLLYGAIGLRFIFVGALFYNMVTLGIAIFSAASILSRAIFFLKEYFPRLSKREASNELKNYGRFTELALLPVTPCSNINPDHKALNQDCYDKNKRITCPNSDAEGGI